MATVQISLPAPHDAQRRVLAEAKRFNVLSCGRRWGKSTIGIDRIVIAPALAGHPARVVLSRHTNCSLKHGVRFRTFSRPLSSAGTTRNSGLSSAAAEASPCSARHGGFRHGPRARVQVRRDR